jgi:hypothetical protein
MQIVCEFRLDGYSYEEESSAPGDVECIHINLNRKKISIFGSHKDCGELLDYMRKFLTKIDDNQKEKSKRFYLILRY